jgi:ubiquinone/menaquinone biosynthesis C-methylase UbiE
MNLEQRLKLERKYHESEDRARSASSLIKGVYDSGVFDEAETYHLDALGDIRDAHVLDYGCGGGWSSARLRARGARVTGFDISETRLAEAKGHLLHSNDGSQMNLVLCAAEALPFADAAFDAVLGKQVLHHLQLDVAIPEIVRVLRPGGKAAFLEPLIHNPLLEGYRRLTPHLRSPTERALSMQDVQWIGAHFRTWSHREFCLLAVLPALVQALTSDRLALTRVRTWLQKVDRTLIDALPFVGQYCWEIVLTLER